MLLLSFNVVLSSTPCLYPCWCYCSVFRDWIVVNDTFLGMYYAMGESCGNINREVQVSIPYILCI